MGTANRSTSQRTKHRSAPPKDAALKPSSVRFAPEQYHVVLRHLPTGLDQDQLQALRPTFEQAQISLIPAEAPESDSISVDGWFWIPSPDNERENRRAIEKWFDRTAALQNDRLVCWLPRSRDRASQVVLPDWVDELPPDRLLVIHSDNPARLANELKSWFRSTNRLESGQMPAGWLWLVHPEDSRHDLELFRQVQTQQSLTRWVLNPQLARQLVSEQQALAMEDVPGIVLYVGQATEWALALAALIWRQIRLAGSQAPVVLLVDWAQRRNHFATLDLPGVHIVPFEAGGPVPSDLLDPDRYAIDPHRSMRKPYIGLRPFEQDDASFFLGRERATAAVLELLEQNRYVFITGASGDGKSSLVNAGLIPALKAGLVELTHVRWSIAYFRPETNPLRNLARALMQALHLGQSAESIEESLSHGFSALVDIYRQSQQKSDRRASSLLLVIDQMEEFFTHGENYSQGQLSAQAYSTATLLAETIETARREGLPIYTLFTLRSDYLGPCSRLPGFIDLVGQSVYFVPQLPIHELEAAIQGPAELMGRHLSPRLLRQLLQDAEATQDALPLLQHALSQIWDCAGSAETLDLPHYNEAAGLPLAPDSYTSNRLRACLNHHAEALGQQIDTLRSGWSGQSTVSTDELLERLFRCLIRFDGTATVRRPSSLSELQERLSDLNLTEQQLSDVLHVLRSPAHTFIRPYAEHLPQASALEPHTLIDLTHESLIRNWSRLDKWSADEVRDVNRLRELKAQTDRWLQNRHSSPYLLSPGIANYFDRWLEDALPHPRWVASHLFPGASSLGSSELEQAQSILQAMRQLVDRSLRRNRLIRHSAVGGLSIIGLLGLLSALLYWNYYHEAEASLAKSRYIIRQERELAEQQRIINSKLAREAENTRLLAEQQRLINEQRLLQEEQRRKQAMGQALEASKAARLAQIAREIANHEKQIADKLCQAAEEQRQLADRQARLERETAERANRSAEQARLERKNAEAQRNEALLFQSRYLAAMAQKQVQARKTDVGLLLALKALPQNLAYPDRPYEPQAEAALYNAAHAIVNETPNRILVGHKNIVTSAFFLPNGTELVTTSQDRTARGWNLLTGQQIFSFTHSNIVRYTESSSDGRWLLTLPDDYQVQVWDLKTKSLFRSLGNETKPMRLARISSDGRLVATVSGAGELRIWERESGQQLKHLPLGSEVRSLVFSPQSDFLLVATAAEGVQIIDLLAGCRVTVLQVPGSGGVNRAVFSPDLQFVVTASEDQRVRIWNWRSGTLLHQLYGHTGSVVDLAFAPHGRWFVTLGSEGNARVWGPDGSELAVLPEAAGATAQVLITHDGQRIACLNGNRQLKLWDGSSFLLLATFNEKPVPGFCLTFHPSGRSLALAGHDFQICIYKVLPSGQELINYCNNNLKRRELKDEELQRYLNK